MKPNHDPYTLIGWAATVAVPIAPAFFFGWRIYTEIQAQTSGLWYLAIPVAALSAFGLEATGILAGHLLTTFATHKHLGRATLSGLILLAYSAIGINELKGSAGAIMFLIAFLIYLLVALRHTLTDEVTAEQNQADYQRQLEAQERQHQRQLEAEKLRLTHQEKLARIQAKRAAPPRQQQRQDTRQDTANMPEDWRQLTSQQRHQLAHASREEREKMFPELASRTRRAWHSRLDEIAAQNGHYQTN